MTEIIIVSWSTSNNAKSLFSSGFSLESLSGFIQIKEKKKRDRNHNCQLLLIAIEL
jgi:hypothetical protein